MAEQEKRENKQVTKKTPSAEKWKKKKWFKIHASEEFDKKVIGETPAEKPKLLENRKTRISLRDLTNDSQKRHIEVVFSVKNVEGQEAYTKITGHQINPSYINRLVRRRNSKMETTQLVSTKDNKKIKIKAVTISGKKLAAKQETAIRNTMIEVIEKAVKKKPCSQIVQEIIFGVLAAKVFKDVKKIAQLKRVEITKSQIIEGM